MTFNTIPVGNDLPWKKFTIPLDGVIYTLTVRFNVRSNRWILDIADSSNNPILVGIPVLIERNLTGRYVISGLPLGTLFATDFTNQENQPTRYSFDTTHGLIYED